MDTAAIARRRARAARAERNVRHTLLWATTALIVGGIFWAVFLMTVFGGR
ncbi:hypothetical protein [Rhizobium rhizosphaerae]|nr:hypothetical protein [Xaviernesmea rhizosphaerae]